jgi:ATP-binding cassette, subfamily G (WHITE), eye pigment precursor transporter
LNALNFRNQGNLTVKGEIRLNNHLLNSVEEIASISGYVQQDDLFVGCMTVRENLIFQAFLRMDKKYTDQERYDRVEVTLFFIFRSIGKKYDARYL